MEVAEPNIQQNDVHNDKVIIQQSSMYGDKAIIQQNSLHEDTEIKEHKSSGMHFAVLAPLGVDGLHSIARWLCRCFVRRLTKPNRTVDVQGPTTWTGI